MMELSDEAVEWFYDKTGELLTYNRAGLERLQKYMVNDWVYRSLNKESSSHWLEEEEDGVPISVGAYLGETIIQTIGGSWGQKGEFLETGYYVQVQHPTQLPYQVNPFGRIVNAHYNPITASVLDFYDRAELASQGALDALLTGRVEKMIVPSSFGRTIVTLRGV